MLTNFIVYSGLVTLGFIAGFVVRRTTEQWVIVKLKEQIVDYKLSIARYRRIIAKPLPVQDELLANAATVLNASIKSLFVKS